MSPFVGRRGKIENSFRVSHIIGTIIMVRLIEKGEKNSNYDGDKSSEMVQQVRVWGECKPAL